MREQTGGGSHVNPVIQAFGSIWPGPAAAAVRPRPDALYRVLVGAVTLPENRSHPLPGFSHAANIINMFAAAGVDIHRDLFLGVVIHGPSVLGCVRNALYAERFDRENPNVALAGELRRAGVELLICGRMLRRAGIAEADLLDGITVTCSGALTLAEYHRRGYILVPSSAEAACSYGLIAGEYDPAGGCPPG